MKPVWLFETDIFDEGNPQRMRDIARELSMDAREVRYVPHGGGIIGAGPIPEGAPVIAYGSLNMCRYVRENTSWKPGVWCDFEKLRCASYYARYGSFLLQQDYAMLPLAETLRRKDWLYRTFGRDEHVFLRPDDNNKSFHGGLVHREQFAKWYETANFYEPGPDCLAVAARPVTIHAEYRLVIADGKPVAASAYKGSERVLRVSGAPDDVWSFAETVARTWQPHPIFALDVAETEVGLRLIEIGSVNGAGLYACDLRAIVEAASAIARRD